MTDKIARATQQVFGGSLNAPNNIAQFGSLAAKSPNYSLDPAVIQFLAAWGNGMASAVVSNQAPALQDLNAVFHLLSRQIAYTLQSGIPEWDIGSACIPRKLVNISTATAYYLNGRSDHTTASETYCSMTAVRVA